MSVAFRVDASTRMGTGHVFRCLALASALQASGEASVFVAAEIPDGLADMIRRHGHALHAITPSTPLPAPGCRMGDETQLADAAQFLAGVPDAAWVVVDHYGLDSVWERAVRTDGRRCMVIDDLGRRHDCDLLLDQTAHRNAGARYQPADAVAMMLGPQFALLRPSFAAMRRTTIARSGPAGRLFLMMGGSDPHNHGGVLLRAIDAAGLGHLHVDIVTGSANPHLPGLRDVAGNRPGWTLHVDTPDVASLMAAADIGIGAGGTATWERCCLGLPTLAVEIADNQHVLLHEAAALGLLHSVEGPIDVEKIAAHLRVLVESEAWRNNISRAGMAAVDGEGARRVAAAIGGEEIHIRRAQADDSDAIHAWRNAASVRETARNPDPIPLEAHRRWFAEVMQSEQTLLLVGERRGTAIGIVRFDCGDAATAEVSIYLTPDGRAGDGSRLLLAAEGWLAAERPDMRRIQAKIMPGNRRSHALFARAGYRPDISAHVKDI